MPAVAQPRLSDELSEHHQRGRSESRAVERRAHSSRMGQAEYRHGDAGRRLEIARDAMMKLGPGEAFPSVAEEPEWNDTETRSLG